jgi:ribosomal protein S18 acetylase RimI-like enzyme
MFEERDRANVDSLMNKLQKHFADIDTTRESLEFNNSEDAHKYMQKMIDDSSSMSGAIFVAEENNEIVGFVQGVIVEHKHGNDAMFDTTHKERKDGWIGLLYVNESQRGKGLGRALMDRMRDHFIENGCDTMRLLVLNDNNHTIEVYKKYGFVYHDVEMVKGLK